MTAAVRGGMPKRTRKPSEAKMRLPQSIGRLDGKKKTLSTEALTAFEGEQVVTCTVRDGDKRDVTVPIKSSEPHR